MSGPVRNVEGLNCPNCGAPQTIRGFGRALAVVCPNCHSVLDAKDPRLQVLQHFEAKARRLPIPLGTRGTLQGGEWEVIGYQERETRSEGVAYQWREYVLFNPYKGFRYLTEYNGHWNFVRPVSAAPGEGGVGPRPLVNWAGQRYVHFTTGEARTVYVLGEFPWQVRVGETVTYRDYIAPPKMLSSETTKNETTWSLGQYMTGAEVWAAFKLPGQPPAVSGIFANQPAPPSDVAGMWTAAVFLLLALVVLALGISTTARNEEVYRAQYTFAAGAVTTPVFELKGRPSDVAVSTRVDRGANAYIHFALINNGTSQAFNFSREVEGRDTAMVSAVPSGQYYLLIDPEAESVDRSTGYQVTVKRDVPVAGFYWIAGLLLLVPPAVKSMKAGSFETRRWQESDYAS
ncbi:MAG: DUF4178 domain-containing protein [Bryobacteraceae bacterium]